MCERGRVCLKITERFPSVALQKPISANRGVRKNELPFLMVSILLAARLTRLATVRPPMWDFLVRCGCLTRLGCFEPQFAHCPPTTRPIVLVATHGIFVMYFYPEMAMVHELDVKRMSHNADH